ncbi:MAG: MiaB/RimO family radical SAM methylthiotransferase [Armatimonadetes bacterium]|nr:MiaB/RimO family radical SAM methylthiotransferase [Armatimonadota bacterium]
MSFRIALTTLGCKVNQADSDRLAEAFSAAGCLLVDAAEPADAYVVNTCTVTLVADRKARKLVRGVARANPQAVVAVTGCYAEGVGRAVLEAMPEVDLVRGNREREVLPQAVLLELRRRQALGLMRLVASGPEPTAPRIRAMLKVQDGCSHVCGFCIVPAVRGGLRSRRPGEVLDEVRRKVDEGVREFVLCGIRLGTYGWDWPERRGSRFRPLSELLLALAGIPGVARLRLSSILPLDVGPDLFALMADLPQVCEHLHLPLQAGDDQTLRRMGRGYRVGRFAALAAEARRWMPGLALATDVLVGYPGETAAQFANTLAFCRDMAFADMHIFSYSPRPGTPAAALPDDVGPAEKQARSQALHALRDELRQRYRQPLVGQTVEVLVEECGPAWVEGLTRTYIRCRAQGRAALGTTTTVRVESLAGETVPAALVSSAA